MSLVSSPLRALAVTTVTAVAASLLLLPGPTTAAPAPAAAPAIPTEALGVPSQDTVGGLTVENSFVSSVGWVKPGETYPSRILLTNTRDAVVSEVLVTVTAPRGTRFTDAGSAARVSADGKRVVWSPGQVAAGADRTLVLESRAATLTQLPTVVWRDISSRARVTVGNASTTLTSHGPKVIPPGERYETARYGDRPFPVVPVDYTDRDYQTTHERTLDTVINDPGFPGSTFNLFQEMSLGQLYPEGTVPSDGIEATPYAAAEAAAYDFTPRSVPGDTCTGGVTYADSPISPIGTPVYPDRIVDGVYQLPGNTSFYGADSGGTAIAGPGSIDSGCGSPGKLVRDAAVISDPEIDYSDFDTDKDGVVDFFMAVFAGCGGNGASQLSAAGCDYAGAPYDNVWPHSSSLEFYYSDPETGLPGYTTDDQLKNLEGQPLWYTDDTYSKMTTADNGDALKVYVRVGPYNVNPETAIDKASVISHEYGHSLGLPDFYSTDSKETYGDWNLMATDKSQNIDAFGRQELGWVVPRVLSEDTAVTGWNDSKEDIGSIVWQTPDGAPYRLRDGQDGIVHNSEMYVAKLPGRTLLDPAAFDSGETASQTHAWWSGSGNDFGCVPGGGHNIDLQVPELATVDPESTVTLTFKSYWDIEWDFDYGFVMTTTDQGESYTSHPSERGYTTSNAQPPPLGGNPNQNQCQGTYDNGLTGTSGSYEAGTEAVDRNAAAPAYPEPVFLEDEYDVSDLAGEQLGALRFSYATDPGLARPGWFIDDVTVTVTEPGQQPRDVVVTDFESDGGPDDERVYNGGCREDLSTAQECTPGWSYVDAGGEAPADHAYYLELRDRSGFDLQGKGQIDRTPIEFGAGLSLVYTDEAHGYGNSGTPDQPAQSPLDSVPDPGNNTPDLGDAAFIDTPARSSFSDADWTDNYTNPSTESGNWEFTYDCLAFEVLSLTGEGEGPPASNGDLAGSVAFDLGQGCGGFDYGFGTDEGGDNSAPAARATATPSAARAGDRVRFSAAGSSDAETPDQLDYVWDFGNGGDAKDATGKVATHAYQQNGTYTATVQVTDPQGDTDTASVEVVVSDDPVDATAPEARISRTPKRPFTATRVTFDAARSSDDTTAPDDLTYRWNFRNGGSRVDATGRSAEARFRRPGKHAVVLTVTDGTGNSDTATQRFRVRRLVPCRSSAVTRAGSWRVVEDDDALRGSFCDNRGRGRGRDVLTLDFTGPQVVVVHGDSTRGGTAVVVIDGRRLRQRLSFRGSSRTVDFGNRLAFRNLGTGDHTIRVMMRRRTGHVEGFITQR